MDLHPRKNLFFKYPAAVLLAVVVIGGCLGISQPSAWADTADESESRTASLKPYMPFDEPKPKIPEKILSDSRLDQRVKIFVKSKNFKQLFAELSEKTGVKLTSSRKLWGERAIIYFHNRPLRDVMAEISGLYGYHWLVKGKSDAYTYELFEGIRHAKRRDQVRQEWREGQDALLLGLLKELAESPESSETLKRLAATNTDAYGVVTSPDAKDAAKVFSQLDAAFLRRALAEEMKLLSFADLPLEWQAAFCQAQNGSRQRTNERLVRLYGIEPLKFVPLTPESLASATVSFGRLSKGLFGFPRLLLSVRRAQQRSGWGMQWPPRRLRDNDLWRLAGATTGEGVVGDHPVPDEPKITKRVDRKVFRNHWRSWLALLVGDVLQAIAEQSDMDVLADYYFQLDLLQGFHKEPLSNIVRTVCEKSNYTCQVDGSTLRFRFNQWFVQPLSEEPPAKLIERLWRKIEETGALGLDEIARIAYLPDRQMHWAGFKFVTGVDIGRRTAATLRLWGSIGPELASLAWTEEGLPVSRLTADRQDYARYWAGLLKPDASPSDLAHAVLLIEAVRAGDEGDQQGYDFTLKLPDGTSKVVHVVLPGVLSEEDRKRVAAQRRADLEADVIEVLD